MTTSHNTLFLNVYTTLWIYWVYLYEIVRDLRNYLKNVVPIKGLFNCLQGSNTLPFRLWCFLHTWIDFGSIRVVKLSGDYCFKNNLIIGPKLTCISILFSTKNVSWKYTTYFAEMYIYSIYSIYMSHICLTYWSDLFAFL